MKKLLATSVIAMAAATIGSAAMAQNIFALVPKNMNNPFFDQARDGCKKAEAESAASSPASTSVPASTAAAKSRCRSSRTSSPAAT